MGTLVVRRMRDGLVTVIDTRPPEEFAAGHLPGAINLPLSVLKRRLRELPREQEFVAYCRGQYCVLSYEQWLSCAGAASKPFGLKTVIPNGKPRLAKREAC
jgi:rhodanese-related sulfurtransferase